MSQYLINIIFVGASFALYFGIAFSRLVSPKDLAKAFTLVLVFSVFGHVFKLRLICFAALAWL